MEESYNKFVQLESAVQAMPATADGAFKLNDIVLNGEQARRFCSNVRGAMVMIDKLLDIFPNSASFSFNGGKDSTVVLHLLRLAMYKRGKSGEIKSALQKGADGELITFYFDSDSCFDEEKEFVDSTATKFDISIMKLKCTFKEGLESLTKEHGVKAIFMGTRRADPDGKDIDKLSTSSPGWPAFLRVNPCLDWKYNDVWMFLRIFSFPYCSLYDRGYTSIGSKSKTKPNEALKREDGTYMPAYMLEDEAKERSER